MKMKKIGRMMDGWERRTMKKNENQIIFWDKRIDKKKFIFFDQPIIFSAACKAYWVG
jgi:hypothetical protein